MTDITMRQLLQAGVHFGHQTRYWAPSMAPYIFGDRNKIHIINLEQTLPMLREATSYLGAVAAQGGRVLFVGTKRQAGKWIREQAIRAGCPFVDYRWLGGMLTNYKTVKNSIARLKDLEQQIASGGTARLNKKEALSIDRECAKLDRTLSGIKDMEGLPDVLFVIDVEHEYIAVAEANKLGIPVVAVVDTNCNPDGIDYIIPGNDDSAKAIQLYLQSAADAIIAAKVAARSAGNIAPEDDEYIEIDDSGAAVATAQEPARQTAVEATKADDAESVTVKTVVKKKVVKRKVVKSKAAEVAAEDDKIDDQAGAQKTVKKQAAKKKTAKKKVVRKKAVRKKAAKSKAADESSGDA